MKSLGEVSSSVNIEAVTCGINVFSCILLWFLTMISRERGDEEEKEKEKGRDTLQFGALHYYYYN